MFSVSMSIDVSPKELICHIALPFLSKPKYSVRNQKTENLLGSLLSLC